MIHWTGKPSFSFFWLLIWEFPRVPENARKFFSSMIHKIVTSRNSVSHNAIGIPTEIYLLILRMHNITWLTHCSIKKNSHKSCNNMKVIHIYTVFVISRYTTSFVGLICNLYGEVCEIIVFVFFFHLLFFLVSLYMLWQWKNIRVHQKVMLFSGYFFLNIIIDDLSWKINELPSFFWKYRRNPR